MSNDTPEIDNFQFLEAVFGSRPEDETIAVCAFAEDPDERTRGWPAYDPTEGAVRRYIARGNANTYYCISTVKVPEEGERLSRAGAAIKAVYVMPLDDIGTGAGAKYSPDSVPLKPSYALETSPGNWQYGYLLDNPETDLPRAQAVLKLMTQDVGDSAAAITTKYIRLPHGKNTKAKYGGDFDCRLTEWAPERRYGLDELAGAFGISEEEIEQEAELVQPPGESAAGEVDTSDEIYEWLAASGSVQSAPDPRGFVKIACPWAHEHTGGTRGAQYSPLGCGGDYARVRQFKCFHEHCADRGIGDLISYVFDQRYVLAGGRLVYDRLRPANGMPWPDFRMDKKPINWAGGNGKRAFAAESWSISPTRVSVAQEMFTPGEAGIFNHPTYGPVFNTFVEYRNRPYTENEDKLAGVLQQIQFLFGGQYKTFLSFLAWSYWRPEVRLTFALLHIAPTQGIGRGWLKQLLYKMFVHGGDYVPAVSFKNFMDGSFNKFLRRSLLVTFDEVKSNERYKVSDRLKELITEPQQEINVKYGFQGWVDVYANIILFSNHMAALHIEDSDRRLWTVTMQGKPRKPDWYKMIYRQIESEEVINQFVSFLKRHMEADVAFNPKGHAPMTEAKRVARAATEDPEFETPTREVIEDLRNEGYTHVYRKHLHWMLRNAGVALPITNDAPGKPDYHLRAFLQELNVSTLPDRPRPTQNDRRLMPELKTRESVYVLDPNSEADAVVEARRLLVEKAPDRANVVPGSNVTPISSTDLFKEGDTVTDDDGTPDV